MRKTIEPQMQIGEVDISKIEFDLHSRDEIPKLLMGLQHIYCIPEAREEVFKILEEIIPEGIDMNNGRPGMELWKILVLGTLRLNCNFDYDKLQEMANQHVTLRQMLGHSIFDQDYKYALQTLKDNVALFTEEVLDKINTVVVKYGHDLCKKKDENLKGRCDSFVVKTNVHFPTDINLLLDAIRKIIILIASLCFTVGVSGWRQSTHNTRKIKRLFQKLQRMKHSTSKNEKIRKKRDILILEAYKSYIYLVSSFLVRVKSTIEILHTDHPYIEEKLQEVERYITHAERQIYHIQRRVIEGEKIPHDEKVFSIFEEHTEWITKGKAGVPQELGLKVCILEDQYGFVLNHKVMQNETDEKIAVTMIENAQDKFPELESCSFDKGFHSPYNQIKLSELLDTVVLPKKGKLSKKRKLIEYSEYFVASRHQHSAVESAINALENHSLNLCPDHGINGFKRYCALAVLARNLQILGNIVQQKQLKSQIFREKLKKTREKNNFHLAA